MLIVIAGVLGVVVAAAYVKIAAKTYTATSKVLIQPSSQVVTAVLPSSTNAEDPTRVAATDLLLMTSNSVAQLARQYLGTGTSASDLLNQVTVSEEPNADLYDITATASSARDAANIADAFASAFVAFQTRTAQQSAVQAEANLRQQLAALPPRDTALRCTTGSSQPPRRARRGRATSTARDPFRTASW